MYYKAQMANQKQTCQTPQMAQITHRAAHRDEESDEDMTEKTILKRRLL
jgi:hypothetical protein